MFIFRAVNIYPSHIDQILSGIKEVGSEYQIILYRKEKSSKDHMTIRVERAQGLKPSHDLDKAIKKTVEREVKKQILVSCDVEVEDYGTLPRSERKTKRVFDNRE
jgi:phenylacetate-CoA ligase